MDHIKVSGGLKKSETCHKCLVDIETGYLVDPCSQHKPTIHRGPSPKKHDAKLQIELGLK